MADSNILKAQNYLNNMYGHRSEWVELDADGITGTLLCQGIIRAFQIENGISPVTGNVGDKTLEVMRNLSEISIMDPDDDSDPNVCIMQCALFAKGYNAGGITGIYYTTGVKAIKQFQEDANIDITGIIDWKAWMGLVSINWFNKASDGDDNIRLIQQQLNSDWSDIIGVGPCDGVVSRTTAYSLIAALQAAEGIYSSFIGSLSGTNFGDQTTSKFPSVLKENQNGEYIKYNKLVQYGLYTNGYNPERFDGIFDSTTTSKVAEFQEFYALTGIGLVTSGEVNCATMKSLLTSKGDTSRSSKACDCSTVLNTQQALDIKSAGYNVVGRYLTGTVGGTTRKFITFEEIENIENAGLNTFIIYQDGGYYLEYFQDLSQGTIDAYTAIAAARRIGVPKGSTIYFAVDFDCYSYQMTSYIVPYFKKINLVFNGEKNTYNYKVGIYAPRYVCSYIYELGLAKYSFVADMSSGFSCNLGYPIPQNWAFDQFYELSSANECQFASSPSFDLDKVAYSGRDEGITAFDDVTYMSPDELASENADILLDVQVDEYVYKILNPLGYYDLVLKAGIVYDKEIPIQTIATSGVEIDISATISTDTTFDFTSDPVVIEVDSNGNLSAECDEAIDNLIASVTVDDDDLLAAITGMNDSLKEIAVSLTAGNIGFVLEKNTDSLLKISFVFLSNDIFPDDDTIDTSLAVAINYEVKLIPTTEVNYEFATDDVLKAIGFVAAIILLASIFGTAGSIVFSLEGIGLIAALA